MVEMLSGSFDCLTVETQYSSETDQTGIYLSTSTSRSVQVHMMDRLNRVFFAFVETTAMFEVRCKLIFWSLLVAAAR